MKEGQRGRHRPFPPSSAPAAAHELKEYEQAEQCDDDELVQNVLERDVLVLAAALLLRLLQAQLVLLATATVPAAEEESVWSG